MASVSTHPATQLVAVNLPGLRPTSLGNYLASLGLLRVVARCWPRARLAWRDDIPCLVGGAETLDELGNHLLKIACEGSWTAYELSWQEEQKKSTKAKSRRPVALWRSAANEDSLHRLDAHIVAATRLFFNPLLGSGGNAGKRKFADGWEKAKSALQNQVASKGSAPKAAREKASVTAASDAPFRELEAWLTGKPVSFLLEKLQAASWFSDANKLFNSGQASAREGQISPWAMVLACEGLEFFAGGASRRLGARTRTQGAFPFVTGPAAAATPGEAGRDRGEVWAPIWSRPASVVEVEAIFTRGRAEIDGRGAVTPAAFAAAILRRGTDAGISCFIRFALGATTSGNTFEPRLLGRIAVPRDRPASTDTTPHRDRVRHLASPISAASVVAAHHGDASARALERAVALLNRLPRDIKKGNRWRYQGLRGPIEAAAVHLAAVPDDALRARALADAIVTALDRVDRNRTFREAGVRWSPLPLGWLRVLIGETASTEARIAAAIVSSFPAARPFALYRFGVTANRDGSYAVPKAPPFTWVWSKQDLTANLVRVIDRLTLDLETHERHEKGEVFARREGWYASPSEVDAWLSGAVDEPALSSWLSRLALLDWRWAGHRPRWLGTQQEIPVNGLLALHGLLLPLLDERPVMSGQRDLLAKETAARTPAAARRLVALLRVGHVTSAINHARSRYSMTRAQLATQHAEVRVHDPARFLASLLIPSSDYERADLLVRRWLRPTRSQIQGGTRHA
ncbi:MAG: type I-U CRISPR-associated protein Csx17 [Deltaproteobacteria bacterium]|nr:type I-U CRISPR-associated protein Csx17 [Deltaproteobacteria bacterium]